MASCEESTGDSAQRMGLTSRSPDNEHAELTDGTQVFPGLDALSAR